MERDIEKYKMTGLTNDFKRKVYTYVFESDILLAICVSKSRDILYLVSCVCHSIRVN